MNYIKILCFIGIVSSLNCLAAEMFSCNYECDNSKKLARTIMLNDEKKHEVVLISPITGVAKTFQLYEEDGINKPFRLHVSAAENATAYFKDTLASVVDDMLVEIPASNEHFSYGAIRSVEQLETFPQYVSFTENYLSFHPEVARVAETLYSELSKSIANIVVTKFIVRARFEDNSRAYFSITYRILNGVMAPQATFLGTTL